MVVSAGVLTFVLTRVDAVDLAGVLTWKVALWMVPTLLAYGAVTLLLESVSILRLAEGARESFGTWSAARIKCASYLMGIVNYALGVGALAVLLRRRSGIALGRAAGIVLLISFTDLGLLIVLGTLSVVLTRSEAPVVQAGALVLLGLALVIGVILVRMPGSLGPLERIRSLSVFEAVRFASLRRLGELAGLRLVFVLAFVAMSGVAFRAFDLHPSLSELVVGMIFVAMVAALPIAVAGVGTSQAAVLWFYRDLATPEALLAMSLVLSAGLVSLRALMGIVFARDLYREALALARREKA